MKFKFIKNIFRSKRIIILFTLLNFQPSLLSSEESYLKEIEVDSSTKFETNSTDLPTNPFEIVEMLRRANSMNDATKPSDAIDDALKSFNMIEQNEKL